MKKVILLATAVICLLFSKAHAQQTSFENNVKLLSNKIDLITKEEKELFVEDVKIYKDDEVLVRIKNDWYIYNLPKGEKKPVKQS